MKLGKGKLQRMAKPVERRRDMRGFTEWNRGQKAEVREMMAAIYDSALRRGVV